VDGATEGWMKGRTSCPTSNTVSHRDIFRSRIFRNGEQMGAAECRRVGGNAWCDSKFPTFGGDKEVVLFGEELKGSKFQNRLGRCYYFNASEMLEKKKLWAEIKFRRKQKTSRKGKEREVVRPPPNGGLLALERASSSGSDLV
jgi:hypothetical protein